MALSTEDFQYFDGKFGETHKRISDLSKDVARLEARPCPDVREHVGVYHRRSGDGNGNGNGRGSYPTVQPDTIRSASISSMVRLLAGIFGIIVGTATFLALMKTFIGG